MAEGKNLTEVREIFQRYVLSPLVFVIVMIPFNAQVDTNFINHKKKSNVCQKWKRIGNPNRSSEDIQWRYRVGNWHRKMCHANNEMQKTTNDRRNRTTKWRKNQNAWRNGNLWILGNIGSGRYQTCGDERKNKKKNTSGEQENYSKPKISSKEWIPGLTILWGTQVHSLTGWEKNFNQLTRVQENSWWCIRPYIPEMSKTEYMYQEKKEEEDLPVFKIASMHCYSN